MKARRRMLAGGVAALLAGCRPSSPPARSRPARPKQERLVSVRELLRDDHPRRIPWDRTVSNLYWRSLGPLDFIARAGALGDFEYVAFAPNPLQLARFTFHKPVGTLRRLLVGARGKFGRLQLQPHRGWMLVCFGTKEDLAAARSPQAKQLPPLAVRATSCIGLLRMVTRTWNVKIRIDPQVLERRQRLLDQQTREFQQKTNSESDYGYLSELSYTGDLSIGPPALSFTRVQRGAFPEIMQQVAVTLGGECERRGDEWIIRRRVDGKQLAAETKRLLVELYNAGPQAQADPVAKLTALGPAAVPALIKALDPDQLSVAVGAARALGQLHARQAGPAVVRVWKRARALPTPQRRSWEGREELQALVEAMGGIGGNQVVQTLAHIVTDAEAPPARVLAAREALLKLHALDALPAPRVHTIAPPGRRFRFTLQLPPEPSASHTFTYPPRNVRTILARCAAPDGRRWALFTSTRLGRADDLWLACSSDGVSWQEFLFTGVQRMTGTIAGLSRYGYSDRKLDVALAAKGDGIRLTMKQTRRSWDRRKKPTVVIRTCELSAAALRKDSDGDGLTDIVEQRLGTDPRLADTDKDGFPDGVDGNPLTPPARHPSDRATILQLLFTYLYGADPDVTLLIVRSREPLHQEFRGYAGPVLCFSDQEWRPRRRDFSAAHFLQFGGPPPGAATILTVDGPVCFDRSRKRAQVHFWLCAPRGRQMEMEVLGPQVGRLTVDRVALFARRKTGWTLIADEPWEWIRYR